MPKKTETKKKAPVKKEVKAEKAQPWTPVLGEKVQHDGHIIAITSFEPLEATKYERVGGVTTTNPYQLESLAGVEPISKEEVFQRIH